MKSNIRLGSIAGIQVGLHYSWFLAMVFVAWRMADMILPGRYPGWELGTYWATGFAISLLVFASVLVHELAHSLVARGRGYRVSGITLFLLGGVSNLGSDARDARDEFLISVVGPLVSFLLFVLLWLVYQIGFDSNTPVGAVVYYMWLINLVVAIFNMVPAFPMDGGRVLRSAVWAVTGSFLRATVVATLGGQVVGALLIAAGLFEMVQGGVLVGLPTALIGWFLFGTATSTRKDLKS